jgi:dTDP-4-amino-4,6-dideoxygalactose transaminase
MTDILAALGVSQMNRIDEFVAKRHRIAERYGRMLSSLPVSIPAQHPDSYSSFHLYVIRLKLGEIERTHRQVYDALRAAGILVNLHYIPVYRQPYYERMGFKAGYCPEAERYHREVISLPMYPGLSEAEQEQVLAALSHAVAS